jgi:hypothetical protein
MNWKLIFLLSLFGLALGVASVFTLSPTVEFVFWIAATLIIAILIARYANGKYFLHGFMVAVVNTFWVTLAQATLFYIYIASHPEYLQMVEKLPPALADHPRRLIVYRSPIIAIISGVFVGLFAWVASKVVNRLR